jgi:hypothetical protein
VRAKREITIPAARLGLGSQLAQGLLLEASIVAKLVRLRLLTLDATVVVLPATPASPQDLQGAPTTTRETAPRTMYGRDLSDATRSIDAAEHLLERARINAASLPPRERR